MSVRPVSVITCTHNRAKLLPGLVAQLRAQDYPKGAFEIIVVDNRSTDNTSQVVEQLAEEPGVPVRYVYEARASVTLSRNRGAEEAIYPYLAYIDDDCSVGPDWLRQLMSGFDLHERVAGVGGLVLLKWNQKKPSWVGPDMEPWFADTSFLGNYPRLLEGEERIVESNSVFKRQAWQAGGGFVGMEQFGSQNMAAGEVLYLLRQLQRQGNKIAFVPKAVMYHHLNTPSRKQILRRAYWQGVSDTIMAYMLHNQSRPLISFSAGLDLVAFPVFLIYVVISYARGDDAKGMFHLTRAIRRVGVVLSKIGLVGDWSQVQSWLLNHKTKQHLLKS